MTATHSLTQVWPVRFLFMIRFNASKRLPRATIFAWTTSTQSIEFADHCDRGNLSSGRTSLLYFITSSPKREATKLFSRASTAFFPKVQPPPKSRTLSCISPDPLRPLRPLRPLTLPQRPLNTRKPLPFLRPSIPLQPLPLIPLRLMILHPQSHLPIPPFLIATTTITCVRPSSC